MADGFSDGGRPSVRSNRKPRDRSSTASRGRAQWLLLLCSSITGRVSTLQSQVHLVHEPRARVLPDRAPRNGSLYFPSRTSGPGIQVERGAVRSAWRQTRARDRESTSKRGVAVEEEGASFDTGALQHDRRVSAPSHSRNVARIAA